MFSSPFSLYVYLPFPSFQKQILYLQGICCLSQSNRDYKYHRNVRNNIIDPSEKPEQELNKKCYQNIEDIKRCRFMSSPSRYETQRIGTDKLIRLKKKNVFIQ